MARTTILDIQNMKVRGERIPIITAYDYTSAQLVDRAGIPAILVGDTLGMVVLGLPTPIPVTIEDMLHHVKAVVRGSTEALVIADMPFLTYTSVEQGIANAGRLIQEGGAQTVKLEGGVEVAPIVARLVELGIPVMGHIGLTPQSVNQLGGWKVQGKRTERARTLIDDAFALEAAGAFAIVLELVPRELAASISQKLAIPTIGIGAGPECDGQVQVWHDLLGLFDDFVPRHTRRFAETGNVIAEGLGRFAAEVRDGSFPTDQNSSSMGRQELEEALRERPGS